MYVRTITSQTKSGSVEYVQLCHNRWNSKKKRSETDVLYNFGRADQLDIKAIKRLVNSLSRLLPEEEGAEIRGKMEFGEDLSFIGSREFGGSWLLDQLWQKLEIGKTLKKLLQKRGYQIPVERLIFAMVANRALAPASKLHLEHWVSEEVYIPDLNKVNAQQLYRAMDFLLEAAEKIQHDVFFSVANLFNLEVDILFLDTTTTYFEVEKEDDRLRKWGKGKDKRDDLPQALIAFAVTRNGIPVRCWVWPGNTSDQDVLPQVKKDLNSWKLGRVIMVQDTGFNSAENKKVLQTAGGHYIIGEKLKHGTKIAEALHARGRFTRLENGLEIKDITIGDDNEAHKRYILVRNPEIAAYEKERREDIVKETRKRLEEIKQLDGEPHKKKACELRAHKVFGHYVRQTKTGKLRLDKSKIRQAEFFDGKYLLSTSDHDLPAEDVVKGYKQLHKIERVFYDLKHLVDIRPVYHRLEDRIKAHVLLCWLAILLIRIVENETNQTWFQIKKVLTSLKVGILKSPRGEVWELNSLKKEFQKILSDLKIKAPMRYLKIPTPRKKG